MRKFWLWLARFAVARAGSSMIFTGGVVKGTRSKIIYDPRRASNPSEIHDGHQSEWEWSADPATVASFLLRHP